MFKEFTLFFMVSGIITFSGCTDNRTVRERPRQHDADKKFQRARPAFEVAFEVDEPEEPNGPVTLRQLQRLALRYNPELAAFAWQIRQAEADYLQASLPPNPELEYKMEEFGGRGSIKGFEGAVNKFHFIQLIELGDKRSKRMRAAWLGSELVQWEYISKQMDIISKVADDYAAVLAAQQRVSLASELRDISQEVLETVSKRVEAGKDSPVEQIKAQVALSHYRIELERARKDLEGVCKRLVATCGTEKAVMHGLAEQLETLEGRIKSSPQIPLLVQLEARLERNPDLARWAAQTEQYEKSLELERAKTIVDPAVSAGIHHYNELDGIGFQLGLGVPIPLFDRNQAGVMRARDKLSQSQTARFAAELNLRADLQVAYQSLTGSLLAVKLLGGDVLPNVQKALAAATEGYRQGKFGYLDVLDAQRTLFEAKGQYLKALTEFHQAFTQIERLTGGSLRADKN